MDAYELGSLLVYAMRYALGRQTYAVNDVCGAIRKHWPRLLDREKGVIKRDIREWLEPHKYYSSSDINEWSSILELP